METKLTKINESQLVEVIEKSGIAIQEGEEIKKSYQPFLIQLAEIHEQSGKINYEKPAQIDETIARELRLKTVKIRTGASKLKDDRKRIYLLKGNLEQAAYNLIDASCKLAEEVFVSVEKAREIAEAKRKKELAAARQIKLEPYTDLLLYGSFDLENMPEEQFEKVLSGLENQRQFQIAEQKRIEQERIEKEKEQERIRLENERLKKEAEKREMEAEAERKRQADILAKQKAEAEAKQRAIEEKARKEREAAEAKALKEREIIEAKLKAEREEKLRLEREIEIKRIAEEKAKQAKEKARLLAEKRAQAAPDKVKLDEFMKSIESLKIPELKTDQAKEILANVQGLLDKTINYLKNQIQSL
jgi:colicin import membrane protein